LSCSPRSHNRSNFSPSPSSSQASPSTENLTPTAPPLDVADANVTNKQRRILVLPTGLAALTAAAQIYYADIIDLVSIIVD
jgi:hypothetical protein